MKWTIRQNEKRDEMKNENVKEKKGKEQEKKRKERRKIQLDAKIITVIKRTCSPY